MPTANPIKLPVVITADGTQAQAGFAKLRNSMQGLERGVGGYLSRQAASVTGMFSQFLTIDGLFAGIMKAVAHGDEVNKRISQFSPEAIRAQTQLEAAQIKQDVATAKQMGPQAAEVTRQKEAALPELTIIDVFMAEIANRFNTGLIEVQKQFSRLITGDFQEFASVGFRRLKESMGQGDEIQMREEQLENVRRIAPLPVPNLPADQQPDNVKQSQAFIGVLVQQLQQLRAMNQQIKAN